MAFRVGRGLSPARQEAIIATRQNRKKAYSQPQTSAELASLIPVEAIRARRAAKTPSPLSPVRSRSCSTSRSECPSPRFPYDELSKDKPVLVADIPTVRIEDFATIYRTPPSVIQEEPEPDNPVQIEERVEEKEIVLLANEKVPDPAPVFRPNVVAVVINKDGKVLCGERSDFKDESFWQCPQGGIDANEDVIEAAKREVQEELGISPELLKPLPPDIQPVEKFRYTFKAPVKKDGKFFDGQEQQVVMFMLNGDLGDCHLEGPEQVQEFKKVEWRNFADIVPFVLPSKKEVYQNMARVVEHTLEACSPQRLYQVLL